MTERRRKFCSANGRAELGDTVWADPWSHNVLIYYQMQGRLRDDLVILSPQEVPSVLGSNAPQPRAYPMNSADWFIQQHRQTMYGYEGENSDILRVLRIKEIVYEYGFEGVPILTVRKK